MSQRLNTPSSMRTAQEREAIQRAVQGGRHGQLRVCAVTAVQCWVCSCVYAVLCRTAEAVDTREWGYRRIKPVASVSSRPSRTIQSEVERSQTQCQLGEELEPEQL